MQDWCTKPAKISLADLLSQTHKPLLICDKYLYKNYIWTIELITEQLPNQNIIAFEISFARGLKRKSNDTSPTSLAASTEFKHRKLNNGQRDHSINSSIANSNSTSISPESISSSTSTIISTKDIAMQLTFYITTDMNIDDQTLAQMQTNPQTMATVIDTKIETSLYPFVPLFCNPCTWFTGVFVDWNVPPPISDYKYNRNNSRIVEPFTNENIEHLLKYNNEGFIFCKLEIQPSKNTSAVKPKKNIYKFVGIRNEGATCYMNSMLQTLHHLPYLRKAIFSIPLNHGQTQIIHSEVEKETIEAIVDNIITINDSSSESESDAEIETNKNNRNSNQSKTSVILELQRLFFQLQTGAISNHQTENDIISPLRYMSEDITEEADVRIESVNDFFDEQSSPLSSSINTNVQQLKLQSLDADMKQPEDKENKEDDWSFNDIGTPPSIVHDQQIHWNCGYEKAVSTSNLMKSFGWNESDAIVQHDIQEFCRVLLDVLEKKFKGTVNENIIDVLFGGKWESYVTCINVDYESKRVEDFHDISLAIPRIHNSRGMYRNNNSLYVTGGGYGHRSNHRYNTNSVDIIQSLKKFIEPEKLIDDNQYYANDEYKKQDAMKGIRFIKFPPVLFLQLKRFEFDWNSNTQRKINDRLEFYPELNLNPFIYDANGCTNACNEHYNNLGGKDGKSMIGPWTYQLFSVMVHSGSTFGGHYYAFINPNGSQWYSFDDEHVQSVTAYQAIEKQFGGGMRSQSAYMLVYIQKKYVPKILNDVSFSHVPKVLREYFFQEKENIEKIRLSEIDKDKKCTVKYIHAHDLIYEDMGDGKTIDINDNICIEHSLLKRSLSSFEYLDILDIGSTDILSSDLVYKDLRLNEILDYFSNECGIMRENIITYYYSSRKNKTYRPNRRFDYKKLIANNEQNIDNEHKDNHTTIITKPETLARFKCMNTYIFAMKEEKRMFLFIDGAKLHHLPMESTANENAKIKLLCLKYFDIFTQALVIVDWIEIREDQTMQMIKDYIRCELIPSTVHQRSYFQAIHHHLSINGNADQNMKEEDSLLWMFEEEAEKKINFIKDMKNTVKGQELIDGDLLVFQLNPFSDYFNKICNGNDEQKQSRSKPAQMFEELNAHFTNIGEHWFANYEGFVNAHSQMIRIHIRYRYPKLWRNKLIKYLMRNTQYKNIQSSNKMKNKKDYISKFTLDLPKSTTYLMIRRKLAHFYDIDDKYIDIWLPDKDHSSEGYAKFRYGYNSRANGKIAIREIAGHSAFRKNLHLQFELTTIDVQLYDNMIEFKKICDRASSHWNYMRNDCRKQKEMIFELYPDIENTAILGISVVEPDGGGIDVECGKFYILFKKKWSAKELISYILQTYRNSPYFWYFCFPRLIKYLMKVNEETNIEINVETMKIIHSLLSKLSFKDFIITEETNRGSTNCGSYFNNDVYRMPNGFNPLMFTNFRMQYLSTDDPLRAMMDDGSIDTSDVRHTNAVILLHFKEKSRKTHVRGDHVRIVVEEDETFLDVMVNKINVHLNVKLEEKDFLKEKKERENGSENSDNINSDSNSVLIEDDMNDKEKKLLLLDKICSKYKFKFGYPSNDERFDSNSILLNHGLKVGNWINSKFQNSPLNMMVILPPLKSSAYVFNMDKPLTINA